MDDDADNGDTNNNEEESSTPSSSQSSSGDGEDDNPYEHEETLLCLNLEVKTGVNVQDALNKVSKYCQSFPFAAVLPVQPLQYLPVYEDGGVELKFLRKKTDIKDGIDGGIRFFINTITDDDDDASSEEKSLKDEGSQEDEATIIEVTAKRNSRGQYIAKLMAEKIVITNFVASIVNEQQGQQNLGTSPPTDMVQVKSIYHKWM